ncbi:Bromodomain transcription factor [Thalictrum thalictroides]|uniref:Bromodomain transcription factor n=1 Tax=Thalictrum thalictroides TaxID=46969 RepID=A0A7J6VS37_THATH|nr:Bromodomain transcription factor [Thalictrum thalictroides]
MSDGIWESGRENEHNGSEIRKKQQGGSDEYGRAITKITVAQICESVGFQNFQQSTLDVLFEVTIRYLRDLGKTAHFYANLGGITDYNAFDVIQGLIDLVSLQGFSGASDVGKLRHGERDNAVSKLSNEPVVISHSSVLETFTPAMGVADTGLCDSRFDTSEYVSCLVLPNKRPIVNFKLGVNKKSLSVPFDLTLQNKSVGETTHLMVKSDAKDEKKWRTEQILNEYMDNSRELS